MVSEPFLTMLPLSLAHFMHFKVFNYINLFLAQKRSSIPKLIESPLAYIPCSSEASSASLAIKASLAF